MSSVPFVSGRSPKRLALTLALLGSLAGGGCSRAADAGGDERAGRMEAGEPVGLFFMTRYSSFSGSLEKAAWYFTPDGEVYRNLRSGFAAEDLAAHEGPKGTFAVGGTTLEITWNDGRKTRDDMERDADDPGFMWDMGIFTPVRRFADAAAAVGSYEGGEFLSRGGSAVGMARSIELRADGTFSGGSVGSVQAATGNTTVGAGSQSERAGRWTLEGYTVTLTAPDGTSERLIAFPFDMEDTPINPDWMFLGGMLYKRAAQ